MRGTLRILPDQRPGRSDLLLYRADGAAVKAFNTDRANTGFYDFFIYVEGNLGPGWTVLATQ